MPALCHAVRGVATAAGALAAAVGMGVVSRSMAGDALQSAPQFLKNNPMQSGFVVPSPGDRV
jgi:hypothetical protein